MGIVAGLTAWALSDTGSSSNASGRARQRAPVAVPGVAEAGAPVPDFEIPSLDGNGTVRIADFRGRPVIVNFWASWCNPCREEFPLLRQAIRDHRLQRLAVVGVVYQDISSDARSFVRKLRARWPQGLDQHNQVATAFGVRALPQSFFVAPDGTIVDRVFGITSDAALRKPLAKLLERAGPATPPR